ncbi:putative polyketide synthase [Xylariales sp. AK1849]|nr:putative polyketide synthase [Xylariales sp. AK1849]
MPMIIEEEESVLEPIAIVGMACRLPGSVDSASKFWETIRDKKSVRTPKVPSNRFNIDAHYHPDLSRPGSFSAMGGYFLDGNPVDFDPSFFNMTPIEAQWLDPQQRKILEVCYEVFENAGVSLEKAAGSNTGVYVASFTADYQQMSIFERDFRHNYAATGVDPGIISNRVNNAFNLNGPSCIINTACSSAVYGIHNACHALRARDCEAAIAAGVNIIMIVDQHMNTAKLGVLSPTSECHTFDERADGYGRAEGVGALYLKRLSDAIRDKDVIRGVIRSSAVNTNGKVEGMGITYPNALGQEMVLRRAYKRANLDPNKTAYLECHGTGTPTGDPIEVRAVAMGMNDTRSPDAPLLLGAAKANIGHSEAASGIFAAMKAALMTENAQIPGVYGFKTLNPNIKDKDWKVKIVEELTPWPADFDVRRASVSSFGYGGTNAHLVIEAIENVCPWYEHGKSKAVAKYNYNDVERPFLVSMSAHDETTLKRNIVAHQKIAADYHLPDLAYSLNERRSKFASRGYTVAIPGQETKAFSTDSFAYGSTLNKPAKVGFVLTGQGAQYARMGYEATQQFPSFAETIDALNRVLQRVEPKPTWSLWDILEAPAESSRVGEPEISQPICTAIQIAVIDLFASWGIEPSVTIGHSSGEIAAAYAAGRISAPEAMLAAYFRGLAVAQAAPVGTMLAVGLGAHEVVDYTGFLSADVAERVTIACENSPGSVTMSGSIDDILAFKGVLDQFNIFSRQLKTGKAYHSHQMDAVAPLYEELYSKAQSGLTEVHLTWRRPIADMVSSVTGAKVEASHLPIAYWCDNLRSRVLFNTALQVLGNTPELADVNILIEIGPHAALGGPIKQIVAANDFDMQYVPSLMRGADSAISLLKAAGELYLRGLDIEFDLVNSIESSRPAVVGNKRRGGPHYLPDLPPYQWNYERQHWYQPRVMAELRESKHPRHDILGRRIFGLSKNASTWRNLLRQRDVPWFADHTLGTDVVFPAAGHMSLAIEALLQQLDLEPEEASGVKFRDINIEKALIVPDTDDGVEVHTRLEKMPGDWYTFTVESVDNDIWTQHSSGKIQKRRNDELSLGLSSPYKASQLHHQVSGKRWYRSFHRVGFNYGPNLQTMTHVRANGKDRVASAGIKVQTECHDMEQESRYMLHPSTIDGCLHAVIAAVHKGLHKEMPWGVIPLEIEEMTLNFPTGELNTEGQCTAWADKSWDRYFAGNLHLSGASGNSLMEIKNWKFITYDAAAPPKLSEPAPRQPYRMVKWESSSVADESLNTKIEKNNNVAVVYVNGDSPLARALSAASVPITAAGADAFEQVVVIDSDGSGASTPLIDSVDGFDKIVVDDSDGSVLAAATEETWGSIKSILQSGKPIVWVTRGANQGKSVASGIPQGFLRAVRSEAISARISLVDADEEASYEKTAALVQHQLSAVENKEPGGDLEFWLTKDSSVLVPRLETNDSLSQVFYQGDNHETTTISGDESYKGKIVDNEVVFEAQSTSTDLAPLEAEIQVSFAEISKDDLSTRALDRARIVTGTIIRTGSALDTSLCGQATVAFTKKTFDTRLVTSTFAVINNADLVRTAAAILPDLVKAVDATLLAGQASAGDHVLVLPTATALFERAVAKLGAHVGFRVSKTPKDASKMQRLLSSPSGPNIAIAGAPNALIPEVWRAMPRGSKFVFSDVPLDEQLDLKPLARGVTLHMCGVSEAFDNTPTALKKALETSVALLEQLAPSAGPVLDIEELSNLDDARSSIADTSASVLSIGYGKSKVKARKAHKPVCFSNDGAYVLVGCLGGLGRSLTTWMLQRGCKNFVFLSRSGTAKPEAADVVGRLKESGANVQVFCVDASDEQAVADVVADVSSKQPIKGVIHAAMVLQDVLYQNMSFSAYRAALQPKMQAAIALDKALGDTPLDFFLMTSSISGVLGNPGQANYCAGNSYLDFLALQRRKRGLAACSIALPMVEDVGVVAENAAIADSLARKMPFGVDEREMLVSFEAGIIQGTPSTDANVNENVRLGDVQMILGLEPEPMLIAMEGMDITDAFWHQDARMKSVLESLETLAAAAGKSGGQDGGGAGAGFTATLDGLSEDEVLKAIALHIVGRAARILGSQADSFKLDKASVASHGIDSMIGVELQSWLFKEFGLQISVQVLSNPNTTFSGLARTVAEQIGVL